MFCFQYSFKLCLYYTEMSLDYSKDGDDTVLCRYKYNADCWILIIISKKTRHVIQLKIILMK